MEMQRHGTVAAMAALQLQCVVALLGIGFVGETETLPFTDGVVMV